MEQRKSKTLTLCERIEVLKKLKTGQSQASIAREYGVNPSQISRILKRERQLLGDWRSNRNPQRKRKRAGKAEEVEEALLRWFSQVRSRQFPVSGPLLMEKAGQLAGCLGLNDFKATVGWLERWKRRNNITFKKQHGERQDADDSGAENWVVSVLPSILNEYAPRDIFNADETGLYWRAIPDGTLAFKQATPTGSKASKERLTILLCCNMDGGEKLEPLVIGKSKQPRCFKNVKRLPVSYRANANSWMTWDLWKQWLKDLNTRMRAQKRPILLLCDNSAAHNAPARLSHVKLVFLPPNTTSLIQPLDQGIIANFKAHYRALLLRRLMGLMDGQTGDNKRAIELARSLSLLDSLHLQKEAWNRVTQATIIKCYRRARFFKDAGRDQTDAAMASVAADIPAGVSNEQFQRYVAVDCSIQTAGDSTDVELCACKQATATDEASDQMSSEALIQQPPATFATALEGLSTIRAYLENTGCQSYERFYRLADLIYETQRHRSVQRTITDYFKKAKYQRLY
ncbi:tigger transposable element-derived protein 4-like [Microcaecilia unicolor]|uniref:Tigger transposable element-derived protein 4-like n=1 Tax=Microcaecilia unicolor TaxID=1415580 RepID=A0A6P7YYE4_9AMPH|nr:tigger transposable element-derived protein 4-like [Microcaecilia unicolor]